MIQAIHQALRARLLADPTLADQLSGVFDRPPAEAALPYAVIGPISQTDASTKTERGARLAIQVAVFTAHRGGGPARRLADQAVGVLAGAQLSIDGYSATPMRPVQVDILFDPVAAQAQAVLRFEALVFEAPTV